MFSGKKEKLTKDLQNKPRPISKYFELISLAGLILIMAFSYWIYSDTISINDLPKFGVPLFSAQVSISAIGIAILSLVSSSGTKSHMGISFSDFVVRKNPKIFKSNRVVIFQMFLLVLGFTMLILEQFIALGLIFTVVIGLTTIHYLTIVKIFNDARVIEEEIVNYYLQQIKNPKNELSELLKTINTFAVEMSQEGKLHKIIQVLRFYSLVFMSMEANKIENSNRLDLFGDFYTEIIETLSQRNNQKSVYTEIMYSMTEIATQATSKKYYILNLLLDAFRLVGEEIPKTNNLEVLEYHLFLNFFAALSKNSDISFNQKSSEFLLINYLPSYFIQKVFIENAQVSKVIDRDKEISEFLNSLFHLEYSNYFLMLRETLFYLLKTDLKSDILSKLFEQILTPDDILDIDDGRDITIVSVMILMYLILVFKESENKEVGQISLNLSNLNREHHSQIVLYLFKKISKNLIVSQNDIVNIKKVLRTFEMSLSILDEDNSIFRYSHATEEFFIFSYTIFNEDNRLYDILELFQSEGTVLYIKYISNKEKLIRKLTAFSELFYFNTLSDKDIEVMLNVLSKAINKKCVKDFELRHLRDSFSDLDNNIVSEKLAAVDKILSSDLEFFNKETENSRTIKVDVLPFNGTLQEFYLYLNVLFESRFIDKFWEIIAIKYLKPRVEGKVLKNNQINLLDELISILESSNMDSSMILGYKNNFYGLSLFDKFNDTLDKFSRRIRYDSGYNEFIIVDNSNVFIKLKKIDYEIRNVSLETLEQLDVIKTIDENMLLFEKIKDVPMVIEKETVNMYYENNHRFMMFFVELEVGFGPNVIGTSISFE